MFKKDPLQIIPFRTYGTLNKLYLKGRALEDEGIDLDKKGWINLLINSWKQFETDEIRDCELKLYYGENYSQRLRTDAEGYYQLSAACSSLKPFISSEGWLDYSISYHDFKGKQHIQNHNSFKGQMLVPHPDSTFGVISDIDDTILHTGVTSRLKWKVAVNTFLRSPEKRKALEGTSEFFQKLHRPEQRSQYNPIFYVSNSPWNLYRYLEYFLSVNEFPDGPLLLRDFRTPFDRTPKLELAHKYHEIYNILNTFPDLNFILIGDCGEKDPYIYKDVVSEFPGRILAIYLRAVTHSRKMIKVYESFRDFEKVPLLITADTLEAEEHASKHGFIL